MSLSPRTEVDSVLSRVELNRRHVVAGSLAAAGFALAVQPIGAATISTDTSGIDAGDVKIKVGEETLPGYRAHPGKGGPFPVVLVVQEIFGVHEHIKDICRRFAKAGYYAIAPELYFRQGDVSQLKTIDEIRPIVAKVPDAQVMADLDAAVDFAQKSGKGDVAKLGITGFCWGGRIVWLYAEHSQRLKAGAAWYGRLVGEATENQPKHPVNIAADIKAPVLGLYGGKDQGIPLDKDAAWTILSKPLVTPQTGPEGVPVNKLLIASGVDIEKEYYLGIVVDRARGCPVLMASSEGGMDIEEVAANTPEKIIKEPIDPDTGLQGYQARKVAFALGFKGKQIGQVCKVMANLVKLFLQTDASLVEINPLIVTPATDEHPDGQVLAIDAKIDFDDNAMFRHKDIQQLEDPAEVDASEAQAAKFGLSYINLDGTIGCLVNGAGLAMATMDIIKLHGGEPANFLDVGGSASEEAVTEAFRIILSDENVKGILVNIFGGIAKCDIIANAIVAAAKEVGFKVPLVVRLEGTNVEPARVILENAKADIPTMIVGSDLTDAAKKITAAIAA